MLVPSCLWLTSPALIVRLDDVFGEPVDTYVNGSQVWLREDGPGGVMLEWRLHPVAGYEKPKGVPTSQVFGRTALALGAGEDPPAPPEHLWEGLEAFVAYDESVELGELRAACVAALGVEPDHFGPVDHDRIGEAWEREQGKRSIVGDLLAQLTAEPSGA